MATPDAAHASRRWRPFVLRTSGNLAEGIYGLVLASSVIAVSREYNSSDAGLVAASVFATGLVFWLAHVYAQVLATAITGHRRLTGAEVRGLLRFHWPLVEVTVPLVLILLLGKAGVVADRTAILAATLGTLLELGTCGAYAARVNGAGTATTILSALAALTLGAAAILLKVLAH